MNYAELLEFYNKPVLIGKPEADKYLIVAAQMLAEEENEMLLRRHKPRKNNFSELLELYVTPVPAVREEEPMLEVKEEEMKTCALCGKQLDVYNEKTQRWEYPESGRPLIDAPVCSQCKVKCRQYEDAVKSSYPDSLQYFVKGLELEDDR